MVASRFKSLAANRVETDPKRLRILASLYFFIYLIRLTAGTYGYFHSGSAPLVPIGLDKP